MSEISVIVPVYDVEKYVKRCYDSINKQIFSYFDLIFVDDGTQDKSAEICDELIIDDERCIIIHQQNNGLSSARNKGIDYSNACLNNNWISFVDSDDGIKPDFLQKLYSSNIENGTKISACRFLRCSSFDNTEGYSGNKTNVYDSKTAYLMVNCGAQACSRLYCKELFNAENRFPVGKTFEDQWLIPRLLFSVPQTSFVDEELYFYFVNPNGITSNSKLSSCKDFWDAYEDNISFFDNIGELEMVRIVSQGLLREIIVKYKKMKKQSCVPQKDIQYVKKRGIYTIDKYFANIEPDRIEEGKAVFSPLYRVCRVVKKAYKIFKS